VTAGFGGWRTAAFLIVSTAVMAASGLTPWISPDTDSWLAPCFRSSCFGSPRFPLFAVIVHGIGTSALPIVQDLLFIAAAGWLGFAVRQRGASANAALAVAVAPPLSTMLLLWGRAVLPDMLAQAALLGALAGTLRGKLFPAALLGTVAYLFKPALLLFIIGLPLLHLILNPAPRRAGVLFAGLLAPFLLISGFRLATVGDFNIVSFGGFQMSGMAALMLTDATIERLPAPLRPEAREILDRKTALIAAGAVSSIPQNSAGVRSFRSVAAGYFDILARTYDPLLYEGVRPTQAPGESWVAFNARLQALALAVIGAEPLDYLAWLVGAKARSIGHLLVFNPGIGVGVVLMTLGAFRRRRAPPSDDLWLLTWLVLIAAGGTIGLTILTTFPAARYTDAEGMLVAALPLYWGLNLLFGEQPRRDVRQVGDVAGNR
jgi:hypothetical protein